MLPGTRFCMMQWLPRWRTFSNPCDRRIRHASSPERARTLPNRNLDLCYKQVRMKPLLDLRGIGGLKEQCQRLDEVGAGFFQGVALAGDIELWAQRYVAVTFTFDYGCQAARLLHHSIVVKSRESVEPG